MRRSRIGWAGAGLLAAAIGAVTAYPAEVVTEAGVFSKYVWRGITYNDDPVVQGQMDVVAGDFGVFIWGNLDLTDYNERPGEETRFKTTEYDVTLYYSHEFESGITLGAGVSDYVFAHPSDAAGTTRDAYLSVSYEGVVTPTLMVFYDFEEVDDLYVSFGLGREFELAPKWTLGLDAVIGYAGGDYNEYYFGIPIVFEEEAGAAAPADETLGADDPAFVDTGATITLSYQVAEAVKVSLMGQYFALVDSEIRDGAEELYGNDDGFVGAAKIEWTF